MANEQHEDCWYSWDKVLTAFAPFTRVLLLFALALVIAAFKGACEYVRSQ